ncbi:hypothetical protein [Azohydromonas australica]|uniref:hypothetical protein n=1 Tax=Azohydromonas australica TaxID=364039 RepID=UPI00040660BB|nr:hypothetical protein [Azohydromonas australica]
MVMKACGVKWHPHGSRIHAGAEAHGQQLTIERAVQWIALALREYLVHLQVLGGALRAVVVRSAACGDVESVEARQSRLPAAPAAR